MGRFAMHRSLATVATLVGVAAQITVLPWPTPSALSLNVTLGYATVRSTGTRFNWYVATLDDLSRFTVQLPDAGCAVLQGTTASANQHGCVLATNAGYFQFSPKPTFCLGQLVINGSIVQWAGDGSPVVGVTSQRTSVMGPLTKENVSSLGVTYAVSGFGVIVLDGKVHAPGVAAAQRAIKALRPTAEEIAPRTVIAFDASNRMLIVAVDGVEALDLGLTMTELAEVMADGAPGFPFQAAHAINLDGGGSTTMSASPLWPLPAAIYNRPTDTDVGPISERGVTSITCIKP